MGCAPAIAAIVTLALGAEPIFVGERRPISVIIFAPTGLAGNVSTSDLIRAASRALETHTSLVPEVFDAALVAECAGRLACIVPRIANVPEYVLAVANLTGEDGPDVVTAIFADTREVVRCARERASDVDACVVERAVLGSARGRIAEERDAGEFLEALFVEQLRGPLSKAGVWEPFGELIVMVRPSGAAIGVDGAFAARAAEGETRIVIAEGEHRVGIELEGHIARSERVVVRAKEVVRLDVVLEEVRSSPALVRTGMIAGGVGLAAIGAGIAVFALARADSGVADVCLYPAGAAAQCGSGGRFQRAAYDPGGAPAVEDRLNPPGLLLAPFGYSLALAGASWALSALWIDPEGDYAWIELAAGVALGAIAYGTSVVLEGSSAFDR